MSSKQSLNDLLSVLGQTIIIVSIGIASRKFNWLPKDTSALSIVVGKVNIYIYIYIFVFVFVYVIILALILNNSLLFLRYFFPFQQV